MNILYLAHRIPFPPNKGDKLRSFRQLERLAKRHRVWCACFVDDPADRAHVATLSAYCHDLAVVRLDRRRATLRGIGGLTFGRTITESFYSHPKMTAVLERWTQDVAFDVVVAFSSSMAPYALQVPATRRVLDLCDLDSQKWLDYAASSRGPVRPLYVAEGNRLALKEQAWLDAFDATILITKAEAEALGEVQAEAKASGKLHIVGNGVTLPDPFTTINRGWVEEDSDQPVIGFVGAMDYRPNADAVCWFVENCWEGIRKAFPRAVFRIVGRSPVKKVRQLQSVPGVEVVGAVEDVLAEVLQFTVSVAPMQI
ncbi:MAG: glycosyltransferase, partial [Phycisphaerales bacterium]